MTKTRLETFSDSVMAIVITLLAFEFKVPIENSIDNFQTLGILNAMIPEFFIFVLSFLTISIMWINHHYITNKIETVTHKTVWANSFLLMCITMIPFITLFLGKNPFNQVSLILYALVMLACSLAFTLLKYSSVPKSELTHKKEIFKHVGVYAYTFAIFVALFAPHLTYFVLLIPPMSYILPSRE
jgi:uncharacterized membrane protein